MVSILNLIGLSVAFATFTIIMMQVRWEYSYGKSDLASDSLYRFDMYDKAWGKFLTTQGMAVNEAFVESSPLILDAVRVLFASRNYKIVGQDAQTNYFNDIPTVMTADSIVSIFDIEMLKGAYADVMVPGKAMVSESIAKLFFVEQDPMGQLIKNQWDAQYEIVGVYKDLPSNATMSNGVIIFEEFKNFRNNTLFVKIAKLEHCDEILENFQKNDKPIGRTTPNKGIFRLINVGDIYFDKLSSDNSFIKKGNKMTTDILFFVGIFVVLIAMINFVNFYMALAPRRVKGLNTRLVFGSSRGALRLRVVSEAVGISVLAFGVSLLWVDIFNSTSLASLMKIDNVEILSNLSTVIFSGCVALVVGVVAGLFPAKYCTSFEPALALKGGVLSTRKGKTLRATLVGFQFVISIVLIVFASFVGLQHRAMVNAPLGFDQENLFTVKIGGGKVANQFCERLDLEPFVEGAALYNGSFGKYQGDMMSDVVTIHGDTVKLCTYMVAHNFLDVLGVPIFEGEGFKEGAPGLWDDINNDRPWNIIVNPTVLELLDVKVGESLRNKKDGGVILGVTSDFVSKSIAVDGGLIAFVLYDNGGNVLIRTQKGNVWQNYDKIKKIIKEVVPENTPELRFYSDNVARLYESERRFGTLITLFSLLAIIISLVGVFGIVAFETQSRKKEIGVRKVFGSSVIEVLKLFNAKFLMIVMVSFAIAVPIAYLVVAKWLDGFAYKTNIAWWVFVLAGLIVTLITILTVTIQSYHTATENPIESLKSE